ncbi:MAG: hypothetical protein JOZ43_07725, partial [Acidobacteriales bacterium]|nr:hypothetical protein [Terriglobales bacterium]
MKLKHLVFALALTNAVLYSCVLPLWEGFDEPFHFGYVESVSVWHELPVLHQTVVSSQIRKSLTLVPLSWLLSEAIPGSISFQQWFRLSREEKLRRARELASLSPALRSERSELLNYEAQQAPLAYLALVPVDRSSWAMPLRREIFRLRLFGAILATVLLYISLTALLQKLGLPDCFQMGVLVCVFESQMLWASVAHVGNDWLAVPLAFCFLLLLAGSVARNGIASLLALTLIFSAGLLTKAYFLAFAPVFAALIIYKRASGLISWRAIALLGAIPLLVAGPWYARNLIRYGSVSGTQQSAAGIGLGEVWAAIPHIPWLASTVSFARWSLWTGNWSFVSFSRTTLNLELILLCVSFVVYLIFFRRITQAELWM